MHSMQAIPVFRGSYGNGYMEKEYFYYLAKEAARVSSPEEDLLREFLEYRVSRLIRVFLLSAANDLESLRSFLESVIRRIFEILILTEEEASNKSEGVRVHAKLGRGHQSIPAVENSLLGRDRMCNLNRSMILGSVSSESVPRLDLTVELGADQLQRVRNRPRVLIYLMESLERAVPLNLDYRVWFRVKEEDWSFRLMDAESLRIKGVRTRPLLGITTGLGSG